MTHSLLTLRVQFHWTNIEAHRNPEIVFLIPSNVCAEWSEHLAFCNKRNSVINQSTANAMTGEIPSRYGMESRPSRSNIHLLHPSKTDEIEVLESGAINHHTNNANGIANRSQTKVSHNWNQNKIRCSYYNSTACLSDQRLKVFYVLWVENMSLYFNMNYSKSDYVIRFNYLWTLTHWNFEPFYDISI